MTWTHIRDTQRTARKSHQCFLCATTIGGGERYVERFGVSYGRQLTMRMHVDCDESTHQWDAMDWETFSPGDMQRPAPKGGA